MKYPSLFAASMFAVTFVVPVLEEIIFRGYLQTSLTKRVGALKAIVMSSALFASFHFAAGQGINNFNIVGTLFVLSLFLGFLRERQGNLLPSMALHATFNGMSILMLLLQVE
jgi:membrane protease YdiL (CAAX protease family)